jgi:hypothetical protein
MDDPGSQKPSSEDAIWAENRRTHRHRVHLVALFVSIAIWLLSAVPLALLSSDQGGGAVITAAYLAAGLAIAVVIRGIYAWRTGRFFWSPWLFLLAAVLAIMSYAVQSAGEKGASPRDSRAAYHVDSVTDGRAPRELINRD